MTLTHINPESMHANPAFTWAVRVPAGADLVFIGGQNGVDESGQVVGPDIASQTRQALRNLLTVLEAAGARPEDVVKWTILIREGASLQDGFAAFGEVWGQRPNPPAITSAFVAGLAVPGALVEIEAVAAVPPPAG
ncbi:RidA family protein [Jiangella aurantiaca]|uniref:RidA family protein n=1 Tax=Jiangella aurantiaca TaxID=2530373 RepID=A0A4R5A422_9ACTN|nr:RidA family protein [Jiangella aurantiaca]TDD66611.1 RidA family protein [Jiangella aurantiaca]